MFLINVINFTYSLKQTVLLVIESNTVGFKKINPNEVVVLFYDKLQFLVKKKKFAFFKV